MKPSFLVDGYCAATASNQRGDCAAGAKGCFPWPPEARVAPSGKLRGLQACIQLCLQCHRCSYVSFSRLERDCSWYHACDLSRLHDGAATGHASLRVRDDRGRTVADVEQFLRAQSATAPASSPPARPPAGGGGLRPAP